MNERGQTRKTSRAYFRPAFSCHALGGYGCSALCTVVLRFVLHILYVYCVCIL